MDSVIDIVPFSFPCNVTLPHGNTLKGRCCLTINQQWGGREDANFWFSFLSDVEREQSAAPVLWRLCGLFSMGQMVQDKASHTA